MSAQAGHIPHDAPLAQDVAINIELPSRRGSLDHGHVTFDGFQLEPVDPNAKVHPSHDIFKDKKTGKHYKKVAPSWSVAHAAAKGKGQPTVEGKRAHGTNFSVGHAIGTTKNREPGTAGSRSGATTPTAGSAMSGNDMDRLVEKLRSVVREEVRQANVGHAQHLERVVADSAPALAPASSSTGEKSSLNGAGLSELNAEESNESKGPRLMTATEAARGLDTDSDVEEAFPNGWAKIRYQCREPFAEFLGCFILITFGTGGDIQALLSPSVGDGTAYGQYLSVSFGWGIGVAMAVWVCGGVSGQINPAVTLALAIFRGFPWKKVPIYWFAQISGCALGALCIIGLYWNPLKLADPTKTQTTASLLTTFPQAFLEPPGARLSGFYNEVYATAVLMMVIVGINDGSNTPPPEGMAPLVLLWLVTGLGACLGWQTAYAVNPARDLGPRIALSIVGYRGLFTFNAWYWLRTPCLGPLVGAPLGCLIYDALIYTGADSPLNKAWGGMAVPWRKKSKKIPAGIDQ